jgi:hypothetical protein
VWKRLKKALSGGRWLLEAEKIYMIGNNFFSSREIVRLR